MKAFCKPTYTFIVFLYFTFIQLIKSNQEEDEGIQICGGFIEIDSSEHPDLKKEIDLSKVIVRTYTIDMIMKEQVNVAQSGYYFLPVYERESLILKITGPYGMVFEPEQYVFNVNDDIRIEDYCKEDNNFKFRGYVVKGQISTFGTVEGPEGVAITLYSKDSKNSLVNLQETYTYEKGVFEFNPIYPGKYIIKPTTDSDLKRFDPNYRELEFNLEANKETFLERALIIKGYEVSGKILSDDAPATGVLALIYSFNSTLTNAYECQFQDEQFNKNKLNSLEYSGMLPFCASKADEQGRFNFLNIPFGQFLIRPFYNSVFMSYEIQPEKIKVDVEHKNLELQEPFVVKSFSISGKVINHKQKGIANVSIKIDGINKAITNEEGFYSLSNLVTGNYDLEAHTDDMYFDPIQNLRITPTSKVLPDFIVKDYKLCGKIHIEANENISSAKRGVLLKEKETNVERRTITDIQGRFCFEVKPATYYVQPILSPEEKQAELHLTPEYLDIEIIDNPRLDVNFYQSKVEVSGIITCLNNCQPDMKVYLTSLKKSERVISVGIDKVANTDKEFTFKFKDILSGQYKLNIQKYEWCWDKEEVTIKVQNQIINDLKFNQVGYSLFFATQYNIKAEWENTRESSIKGSATFKKTESKICLPKQGEYKIFPKSCHKFEKEFYLYDTEKKERLHLVPSEFLVNGSILLSQKVHDELTADEINRLNINIAVEEIKNNSLELYKKINDIKTGEKYIQFSFYTKSKTNLLITPEIISQSDLPKNLKEKLPKLLFYPKFKQIRVEESCSENPDNLKFEMRVGLIINGKISPPMEGVKINAYNKETNEIISSADSLTDGTYQIGPLYTEFKYDIKAIKDGYKITATSEDKYSFIAEKLSFLRVKIIDNNNKPLSGVILSLSSADKSFKINNNTNAEGYYDFIELYSGDYSIKPLLKEYKFEPSERVVKIVGGEHYVETIVAHRVAFSIYGKSKSI